jgi:hypothetical protein
MNDTKPKVKLCQSVSSDVKHYCQCHEGHSGPHFAIEPNFDGTRTKHLWKQASKGSVIWYFDTVTLPPVKQTEALV